MVMLRAMPSRVLVPAEGVVLMASIRFSRIFRPLIFLLIVAGAILAGVRWHDQIGRWLGWRSDPEPTDSTQDSAQRPKQLW